jgi:hypothetical protein
MYSYDYKATPKSCEVKPTQLALPLVGVAFFSCRGLEPEVPNGSPIPLSKEDRSLPVALVIPNVKPLHRISLIRNTNQNSFQDVGSLRILFSVAQRTTHYAHSRTLHNAPRTTAPSRVSVEMSKDLRKHRRSKSLHLSALETLQVVIPNVKPLHRISFSRNPAESTFWHALRRGTGQAEFIGEELFRETNKPRQRSAQRLGTRSMKRFASTRIFISLGVKSLLKQSSYLIKNIRYVSFS